MKRTERLFAISEVLRARRTGLTAQDLAERFNVSIRTIYRDLDALRIAHFPLLAEAGPGGGYALDRAYRLPPINFTAREAALLVAAAGWLTRYRLIPFVDTLNTAIDKVRAAMPPEARRQLDPLAESLSFIGVPQVPVDDDVRRAVEEAWYEGRPLQFTYVSGVRESHRRAVIRSVTVDRWEVRLNCDDLDKGEPRQFLLNRITAAKIADDLPT